MMNEKIKRSCAAALVVAASAFFAASLFAEMPPGINYQGRYIEDNVPFTGAKNNCRFKIHDHPTSGTLRWSSPLVSINFDKGLFNYVIECSTHDWRAYDSYLEVEIGGVPLAPRERLQASPYAFYASSASFAYEIPALSVDAGKLAANAVTSAKILDGTIATADLGDRQVTSAKLLVLSTYTLAAANITTAVNTWSDMTDMYGTLNVSSAPATVFLYFNCTAFRTITENGWPKVAVRFNVDGTAVGYAEFAADANGFTGKCPLGLNAVYRVTSVGDKVVKVQWRSGDDVGAYGTANAYNRNFSAFVLGAP